MEIDPGLLWGSWRGHSVLHTVTYNPYQRRYVAHCNRHLAISTASVTSHALGGFPDNACPKCVAVIVANMMKEI